MIGNIKIKITIVRSRRSRNWRRRRWKNHCKGAEDNKSSRLRKGITNGGKY
jgi:hypothetical protein